jgi:hypothetical protein
MNLPCMVLHRRNDNIMRPTRFDPDTLQQLFERRQIASLPELKSALGTEVAMTVFRKLSALSYLTSYSHRGAYYTLPSIARFDEQGLWDCRDVWFSRHGTLLDTLVAWVSEAPAGYFAGELEALVHVPVKDPLRTLVERGRLSRHVLDERWLYCAPDRCSSGWRASNAVMAAIRCWQGSWAWIRIPSHAAGGNCSPGKCNTSVFGWPAGGDRGRKKNAAPPEATAHLAQRLPGR